MNSTYKYLKPMKVRLTLLCILFCLFACQSFAQIYAVTDGAWDGNTGSTNNIWSTNKNDVLGTVGLRPTASDDVYTNGKLITVGVAVSCRNLYVSHNTANSLTISQLITITITGTLSGWDVSNDVEGFPITNVISFGNGSSLVFTASNIQPAYDPYVIYFWDASVPLGRATFNFGSGVTKNVIISLDFGAVARVQSGTLSIDPGAVLSGSAATLRIDAGASLVTDDPIGSFNTITCTGSINTTNTISASNLTINSGGSLTTSSTIGLTNNLTINSGGQLNSSNGITTVNTSISGTCNTSSFLNTSTNFTLGATGILATTFNGATQTEGWWSNTNRPGGSFSIDPSSTVNFSATANQNIPVLTFGNLTLSGSGTKTVSGTGSLIITGNVTNNSSSSTFNVPSQEILFSGAAANQVISGSGAISFGNGLEVDKSSGSLTLNRPVTVANGLIVTAGTLNLGSQTLTLSSGNIANNGTFTPGTSTVIVNGTSSIAGSNAVNFNHLTIGASGNFTAPSGTLNIAGNLSNNGTFNSNSGTLVFNGSQDQSIAGSVTINNLTVNNTSTNGVGVGGVVNLTGILNLSSGKFDADGIGSTSGVFTVKSTSINGGGSIGNLTTPSNFSGNVTIERFINNPADWRYLSIPVKGADVSDLADDITVTGFSSETCTADGVTIFDCSAASIYEFTSSTQAWTGLTGTTYSNTLLSSLKGYSIWSYLTANTILDMRGDIEKGSVTISSLNSTSGTYSLIPNPYPSAIDWDGITNTGFSNNIYLTTSQGNFATYTKGSNLGVNHPDANWSGQIAMGQSFWIESSGGNSSLVITESAKVGTYEFVREAAPKDYFKMKLKSSENTDELAICFRSDATTGKDSELDAVKRLNDGIFNFSSYTTDPTLHYAINAIPTIQCNETVKLNISDVSAGQYTITFSHLDKLELGYELMLADKFLGIEKQISAGLEYTFDITDEAKTYGGDRFEIKVTSPLVDLDRDLQLTSLQECSKDYVRLEINNTQSGIQYLFKAGDEPLHEPITGYSGASYAFVSKTLLDFGVNSLSLVATSLDGCNAHVFNDAISVRFDAIDEINSVVTGQHCSEGSVTLSASGVSSPDGYYHWYESENAIEPVAGANSSEYSTPILSGTKTYYVSAINGNGCESVLRVPVEAKIIKISTPQISIEGDNLVVSAKTGIQWFKDGSRIDGATSTEYTVKNSGVYTVSVLKDGCSALSEGFEFIINGPETKNPDYGYTLSPNPTSGILYINGPLNGISVSIYDSKGRKLNIEPQMVHDNQFAFDLSATRNGLYLVNIESSSRLIQLKAIKK